MFFEALETLAYQVPWETVPNVLCSRGKSGRDALEIDGVSWRFASSFVPNLGLLSLLRPFR